MWSLVLLLACKQEPVDVSPVPKPEPTQTTNPLDVNGTLMSMACEGTDNALLVRCVATTSTSVGLSVVAIGPTERSFASAPGTEHELVLWGLRAESEYAVTVATSDGSGSASGVVQTKALPVGLRRLGFEVEGDRDVSPVLSTFNCEERRGAVLVDEDAFVIAYAVVDDLLAVGWDGQDGFVGMVDNHTVVRRRFDGMVRFETQLVDGALFGPQLHHDAIVDDLGRTWVLEAHLAEDRVVDGLFVLDEEGDVLTTWALDDHLTPVSTGDISGYWNRAFPLVNDWSHANALAVQDGLAMVSLRHLSAVVAIDADEPGGLVWTVSGESSPDISGDMAWTDGGGFVGQHGGLFDEQGRLLTFDNGPAGERSRVLAMNVNFDAGTVEEAWSWPFEQHCSILGGAIPFDGRIVATCGTAPEYVRIAVGEQAPVYRRRMTCDGQRHPAVPRFIPVDL